MTVRHAMQSKPRGITGRHVLAAMLSFFGVIVVADAVMIYNAVTTFGGVENANAYREGLAYNTRIERQAQQASLGWHDRVELKADPARLSVAIEAGSGGVPASARVEAVLARPATNRTDVALRLAQVGPGVFEAPVGADVGAGTWIATVRVYAGDAAEGEPLYQTRRRLWVAP